MLNPPFLRNYSRGQRSPAVTKSATFYYPIWLAYAAGAVHQAGHEMRLVDAPANDLGVSGDMLRRVSKLGMLAPNSQPTRLVG